MQNTLGISLGTRVVGLAATYDGDLSAFRVRTYYSIWSDKKRKSIIADIQRMAVRYRVRQIIIKLPKASNSSRNIQRLLSDLRHLSAQSGIHLSTCTLIDLKERYTASKKGNSKALVRAVIEEHRQPLETLYNEKKRYRSRNYVKMYEAIACLGLAKETRP